MPKKLPTFDVSVNMKFVSPSPSVADGVKEATGGLPILLAIVQLSPYQVPPVVLADEPYST